MAESAREKQLKPFEALGFIEVGEIGNQVFGNCVLCGKERKFYINVDNGMWDCKVCAERGNIYTLMTLWYEKLASETDTEEPQWKALSESRGLKIFHLAASGMVWDYEQERWIFPIRNRKSAMVSLRTYKPGSSVMALGGLGLGLWGHEEIDEDLDKVVYIVEGEWDRIALRQLLKTYRAPGIVVSVPGAGTFNAGWSETFKDRDVVLCYDHDGPGQRGCARAITLLENMVARLYRLEYPEEAPEGFDLRDFVKIGGNFEDLWKLIREIKEGVSNSETKGKVRPSGPRPTFEQTLEMYAKWLEMTPGIENGIRLAFAVVLALQIDGDPLWLYLVGPPGSAKTVIINSLRHVECVVHRSNITAASLVSGFRLEGDRDPSLIPQLNGKIFCLKDMTEILSMNALARQEIYGLLRGAYDGECEKQFGNGIERKYYTHFHMLAGVTQIIFAERSASLGERFLMFQILKGVGFDAGDLIRAALSNVGDEEEMKEDLCVAAAAFLNHPIGDLPEIKKEHVERIVGLAQLTAMLRGSVERSFDRERLMTQPFHEVGTRLAKQLKKLLLGLSLLREPPSIEESDFELLTQVALDTCAAFSLEIVYALARHPGIETDRLAEITRIPVTTLRDKLLEMQHLGCVQAQKDKNPAGRGAPTWRWAFTKELWAHWRDSRVRYEEPLRVKVAVVRQRKAH